MIELMVLGLVGLALFLVLGIVGTILSLVFGLVLLPFKLLGLAFRGVAFLIALPLILLFAILGVLVIGGGLLALFVPLLPLALVGLGLWWLLRRRPHPAAS